MKYTKSVASIEPYNADCANGRVFTAWAETPDEGLPRVRPFRGIALATSK